MAQDEASAEQPAAQDGGKAETYDDMIGEARKKGFQMTREEYEDLMKKARERVGTLKKEIQEKSLGGGEIARTEERTVALEVVKTKQLVKGETNNVTLHATYEDNDEPVTLDRLQVYHTKPIHVMINEPQLNDYTHAHPVATDKPAEYRFTFMPLTDCSYRAWVDIYPYDGAEQTAMVEMPGVKDCTGSPVDETVITHAEDGGYQFALSMNTKTLAKDQDTMLAFNITDENGEDFEGLQPVMGAYAHLVGFRSGFDGVAHIHPMGDEPVSDDDRGGPRLAFHIRPKEAGYMRFYLQVLIDDKMRFIPFGLNVAEEGAFSGQGLGRFMKEMKANDMKRGNPAEETAPMDDAHEDDMHTGDAH